MHIYKYDIRKPKQGTTCLISKFLRSSGFLKFIKVGNSRIMFRPSSMIGVRQYAQLTLQGNVWTQVFSELSYQPKSWWPWVKLMSSLWKMADHWKGAPWRGESVQVAFLGMDVEPTVDLLTGGAMAVFGI